MILLLFTIILFICWNPQHFIKEMQKCRNAEMLICLPNITLQVSTFPSMSATSLTGCAYCSYLVDQLLRETKGKTISVRLNPDSLVKETYKSDKQLLLIRSTNKFGVWFSLPNTHFIDYPTTLNQKHLGTLCVPWCSCCSWSHRSCH